MPCRDSVMDDNRQRSGRARLRGKVVADLIVWSACGFLAFVLRVPNTWWELRPVIAIYLVVSLPVLLAAVVAFKLHRRAWRRFAIEDVRDLRQGGGHRNGRPVRVGTDLVLVGNGVPANGASHRRGIGDRQG